MSNLGNDDETISSGLGADSHSRKFLFKKVFDECSLTSGVLADQQNHWFRIKVRFVQRGRMEIVES